MADTRVQLDRRRFLGASAAVALGLAGARRAAAQDDGWRPLFNGHDLSNFVNINGDASTWSVRDGMIVTTGKPICILRTDRMYENFELELDWRHMVAGGNAGLFVWSDALTAVGQPFTRAIEVQVLDGLNTEFVTSHGDVFAIHGARMTPDRPHPDGWSRCLPSERRAKPSPQWNHYHVVCNEGTVKLAVNGKVVSGGYDISPRKGYICLESEGSEAHFRNFRIRELPATGVAPADTASEDEGFTPLYGGVDFAGFSHTPEHRGHWVSNDWRIASDGNAPPLWTDRVARDFDLIVDYRVAEGPRGDDARVALLLRGDATNRIDLPAADPGGWRRARIEVRGESASLRLHTDTEPRRIPLTGARGAGPLALDNRGIAIEWANIFLREPV